MIENIYSNDTLTLTLMLILRGSKNSSCPPTAVSSTSSIPDLKGSKNSSCPPTAVSSTSSIPDLKNAKESKVVEDIKKAIENKNFSLAASILQKYLEDENNIPLNIAVTGQSGVGKSTFINAFRGIDDTDERAAPTGEVETTMKPKAYPHPTYPNVALWDLPGIGTPRYPAVQYMKLVEFEKFDFFILVSDTRFNENDAKLAKEITKMGKKLYFVHSKIDSSLNAASRRQKEYDEEKKLQEIREYCIQGLKGQGVASPQVFLVSSFDLHLYEFRALQDTMERELPSHKRDVLILALPNICKSTIDKKKEVFHSKIWLYALLSATVAAIPIAGISIVFDVGILVKVIRDYLLGFGLDKRSLEKCSSATNTPLDELMAMLNCFCSGKDVTKEVIIFMLKSATLILTSLAAEEGSRLIPLIGIPIAAALSFTIIYMFLESNLNELSVDAENIVTKALTIK
ncbi:interferon-inducible GTPase 5-like isoform X2 [Gadus chalcogrammus]|uniref:interferon-inducible GTPase 5-like isoform X2 n=1 Tax=Gadus chalcogrammus TaxID=1042646 RepID=UPI0024C4B391|nr:interferon-inducible GTPase 5-like isoform X2 [Gadus chalcogrammus]